MTTVYTELSILSQRSILIYSDHWKVVSQELIDHFDNRREAETFWRSKLIIETNIWIPESTRPEYASFQQQVKSCDRLKGLSLKISSLPLGPLFLDLGPQTPEFVRKYLLDSCCHIRQRTTEVTELDWLLWITLFLGHPLTYRTILQVWKDLGFYVNRNYLTTLYERDYLPFKDPPTLEGLKNFLDDSRQILPTLYRRDLHSLMALDWTFKDIPQLKFLEEISDERGLFNITSGLLLWSRDLPLIKHYLNRSSSFIRDLIEIFPLPLIGELEMSEREKGTSLSRTSLLSLSRNMESISKQGVSTH